MRNGENRNELPGNNMNTNVLIPIHYLIIIFIYFFPVGHTISQTKHI